MYFTANALQADRRVGAHLEELYANRSIWNDAQGLMVHSYRSSMTAEMLACNDARGFTRDFWMEIDRSIIQLRGTVHGMEILDDLMGVQTTLPIGKTAKLYNMVGDIADDVSISIDGQAPYSFDHTEYASDGDPIPVFTAGYGVNWRHAAGLNTVGIDLVLDSQRAKLKKYNAELVSYMLDGNDRIQVESYPGQGLRNHRNTIKMDLGVGGADIDLTTAPFEDLLAFFQTGAFNQMRVANEIAAYDVMWVSQEIWGNLSKPYVVSVNGSANGIVGEPMVNTLLRFANVRQIRPSFALKGNEFLMYVKDREYVSPLVGMTTGVVPLPRLMPQNNYNFQIMGAMGIQVSRDFKDRSGVVYGSNITAPSE